MKLRDIIILIIIIILIVIILYPKPCDRIPFSDSDVKNCKCVCVGFKKAENNGISCYGMPVVYSCSSAGVKIKTIQ